MTRKRRVNSIQTVADGTAEPPEAVDMNAAVATFLRYCQRRNLSAQTVSFYRTALELLGRLTDLPPRDITTEIIGELIEARQAEGTADNTINTNLRAWRAFFNFLHGEGFIGQAPRITILKTEQNDIETFSKAQMKRLLDQPDRSTFTGYRDYVIMLTLLDTGMRLSELAGLTTSDADFKARLILVNGKGRKKRYVPMQDTLARHLAEYLAIRGPLHHDILFVNIDNEPYRPRTIQQALGHYGAAAGITNVRVSPHTFRHTFARYYIVNGGDVFSLQKILGHTTLDMVRKYVNLFGTDVARQHRKFSPLERLDDDDDY